MFAKIFTTILVLYFVQKSDGEAIKCTQMMKNSLKIQELINALQLESNSFEMQFQLVQLQLKCAAENAKLNSKLNSKQFQSFAKSIKDETCGLQAQLAIKANKDNAADLKKCNMKEDIKLAREKMSQFLKALQLQACSINDFCNIMHQTQEDIDECIESAITNFDVLNVMRSLINESLSAIKENGSNCVNNEAEEQAKALRKATRNINRCLNPDKIIESSEEETVETEAPKVPKPESSESSESSDSSENSTNSENATTSENSESSSKESKPSKESESNAESEEDEGSGNNSEDRNGQEIENGTQNGASEIPENKTEIGNVEENNTESAGENTEAPVEENNREEENNEEGPNTTENTRVEKVNKNNVEGENVDDNSEAPIKENIGEPNEEDEKEETYVKEVSKDKENVTESNNWIEEKIVEGEVVLVDKDKYENIVEEGAFNDLTIDETSTAEQSAEEGIGEKTTTEETIATEAAVAVSSAPLW